MTARRLLTLLPLSAAALLLCGCPPQTLPEPLAVEELIARHNANAAAVPRLWARARVAVTLEAESGLSMTWGSTSPLAEPNGLLLLAKGEQPLGPHDFCLIGRETAALEVFRLGSYTRQQVAPGRREAIYYFWYRLGDRGGAWWGRQAHAGAPGVQGVPINPNQLLAVLAVCALPEDLAALPGAALTLRRHPPAYVVTCFDRRPVTGRIGFRRKVLFNWDDEPPRPFQVDLIAPDGRRALTARLRDYRPIAGGDEDGTGTAGPRPVMPTDILLERVDWPAERGPDGKCVPRPHNPLRRIHIVLTEMTTEDKWLPEACEFRPPGGSSVQVDWQIGEQGGDR